MPIFGKERVLIKVEGSDGQVVVGAAAPCTGCFAVAPPPSPAVLELDGEDTGRRILQDIEPSKLATR